eukprot:5538977-Amphidinium_carterae.6
MKRTMKTTTASASGSNVAHYETKPKPMKGHGKRKVHKTTRHTVTNFYHAKITNFHAAAPPTTKTLDDITKEPKKRAQIDL